MVYTYQKGRPEPMATPAPIQVLIMKSDDESSHEMVAYLSKALSIEIADVTSNATETLQHLVTRSVDVILLDLSAKGVDGIELTKEIKKSYPKVRVIVSTANNTPEAIFAAMEAGADGYVLHGNHTGLEMAICSVRLGTVWLDPGIAAQVLDAIVSATSNSSTRILQTGLLVLPLMPEDKNLLSTVASSNCANGVCMVDPSFVRKLRRYAPSEWSH
jgi:DNA-binding NarL/FixJ family response regulator